MDEEKVKAEETASEPKQEPKKRGKTKQLEEKVDELNGKIDELNDKYTRMLAEYDNYRKRTTKELDQRVRTTKANVIGELLPVLDNFDRAANGSAADEQTYRKGIDMIFTQFKQAVEKLGVEEFGAVGDKFDPKIHNAVMHEDTDDERENEISDVFMKGYKLGDTIIRPATVKVVN